MKKKNQVFSTIIAAGCIVGAGAFWLSRGPSPADLSDFAAAAEAAPAAKISSDGGPTFAALPLENEQAAPAEDAADGGDRGGAALSAGEDVAARYAEQQLQTFDTKRSLLHSAQPVRRERAEELRQEETRRREAAFARAAETGIPTEWSDENGNSFALQGFEAGRPLYKGTMNWRAAISTAANLVRRTSPYNVDGGGITVGVWDGGPVRDTHQEFRNRVRQMDTGWPDHHATHVAGTIAAAGINEEAIGMAPGALIDSYDWAFDIAEMTERAARYPWEEDSLPISNHSYGIISGWQWIGDGWMWFGDRFGRYSSFSQEVDEVTHGAPYYLSLWAAGNDRTDNPERGDPVALEFPEEPGQDPSFIPYDPGLHPVGDGLRQEFGFNTSSDHQIAKNILVVGAVHDAVTPTLQRDPNLAELAEFSSIGPTLDGRILPHLVGSGVNVLSPLAFYDWHYGRTFSGTSMATPNVTGSTTLLIDYYRNRFPGHALRASSLKALLIHAADDIGEEGPDYFTGFGLMNTRAAADHIRRFADSPGSGRIHEDVLRPDVGEKTYDYVSDGRDPIRVTIAWTDVPFVRPDRDADDLADDASASVSNGQTTTRLGVEPFEEHDTQPDPQPDPDEFDETTPVLVNNLDVRVVGADGTVYQPYVLDVENPADPATTGKNDVDNVEQIFFQPPVPGVYQVVVTLDGDLEGEEQVFSLIVSGATLDKPSTAPVITSVDPERFEQDEFSELTIAGENFLLGTNVWLSQEGQEDIPGVGLEVFPDRIVARFDMHGRETGVWTLNLQGPDDQETMLADAVTLEESCGFSIEPESRIFTWTGGEGTIDVTSLFDCGWTAEADVGWIEIVEGESGQGNGTVTYRVLPFEVVDEDPVEPLNEHEEDVPVDEDRDLPEDGPRTGTITVAGLTHTVVQLPGEGPGVYAWFEQVGGRIETSPALGQDATIYFGNNNSFFYAMYPDGSIRWRFRARDQIRSTPAIGSDGTIYFGSHDGNLYALNRDGTLNWKHRTGGRITASPAIGNDGTVYIGSWDGHLYALNPDGSLKWSWNNGPRIRSSVAIAPTGVLYVGSADRHLYAINPDGSVRWRFETEGGIESSPAIDSEGNIYFGSNDGRVYALDHRGDDLWFYQTGGQVVASPIIGPDDMVYVGSTDGIFYALRHEGLSYVQWVYAATGPITTSAALNEEGTFYLASADGFFHIFEFDPGENGDATEAESLVEPFWTAATSAPVVAPEGIVYLGSWLWLDAIWATGGPELDSWSVFQADAQHTGRAVLDPADLDIAPPKIVQAPEQQWGTTRGHVTFSVEVESETAVTYQWRRDGEDIEGANEPTLVLRNLTEQDAGSYTVLITQTPIPVPGGEVEGGSVESEPVELVVDGITDYDFSFDVENLVYDLTGTYDYEMDMIAGTARLNYNLVHDDRGQLSGSGSLDYSDSQGSFSENIDLRGRFRGVRNVGRGILQAVARGDTPYAGEQRRFNIGIRHRFEVDHLTENLRGPTMVRASLQGIKAHTLRYPNFEIPLPPDMDGTWELRIRNLRREGRRIAGDALAILSNGEEIAFDVQGGYVPRVATLRLTLIGQGDRNRNRFQVAIRRGEPVVFRGNFLGQTP